MIISMLDITDMVIYADDMIIKNECTIVCSI